MDARIKSGHDGGSCAASIDVRSCAFASITGNADMTDSATPKPVYGVSSIEVMASMPGLDFVRGIFAPTLPEPPIMENVEPFDCTAEPGHVVIHSIPGLRNYNPIGSGDGGLGALLLASPNG